MIDISKELRDVRHELDLIQSTLENNAYRYPLHPSSGHMKSAAQKISRLSNEVRKLESEVSNE